MKEKSMFVNGQKLLQLAPIADMIPTKERSHGVSHGLAEAGYDIRIKQDIQYINDAYGDRVVVTHTDTGQEVVYSGNFCLASTIDLFQMPACLVGNVKDKSTWARKGLSVFNTVIEPQWNGYLTLELVFHGSESVHIPAGAGIAQVLFGRLEEDGDYGDGKYQHAADKPQEAIAEHSILAS